MYLLEGHNPPDHNTKEDMEFRRFMMRGQRNVTVEWTLLSIAYNVLKLHNKIQNGRLGIHMIKPRAA